MTSPACPLRAASALELRACADEDVFPFPRAELSPSWRACALSSVSVGKPHDIVELGRRCLEHVAVRDRFHLVNCSRGDAERISCFHVHYLELRTSHVTVD